MHNGNFESLMESNLKELRLRPWEEVVGTYKGLDVGELEIIISLSCNGRDLRLIFLSDRPEADILRGELSDELLGRKIGVMKCDDVSRPLRIRIINSSVLGDDLDSEFIVTKSNMIL